MSETQKRVQNLTASQRLENLEYITEQFLGANQSLVEGYSQLRSEVQALKEMFICSMELVEEGVVASLENIQERLTQKSVQKLIEAVRVSVEKGELVADEEVNDNSFVVCQELDAEQKVLNPRIQFLVSNIQNETLKAEIVGKMLGEQVKVLDSSNTLKLLEIYRQPQK